MGLSSALLLRRKCAAAAFAGGGRGTVHHPIATTTALIDVAAQAAGRPRAASTSVVRVGVEAAARLERGNLGRRWPTVSDPRRRRRSSVAATVPSANVIVRFRSFSSASFLAATAKEGDGGRHADKGNKSDSTFSSSSFWDDDSIGGLDRSQSAPPPPKAPSAIPPWERPRPRCLPTRHSSRQFPGPVCPHRSVPSVTDELLNSEVGSLFSFYDGGEDEQRRIHEARERFEYCLRGHSALIPGSYISMNARNAQNIEPRWRRIIQSSLDSLSSAGTGNGEGEAMTISERVETMYDLLQRLEEEGDLYRRSQRGVLSVASSEDDGSDEEDLLFGRDYHHENGYDEEGDLFPSSDSSSSDSDSDSDSDDDDEELEVVDFEGKVYDEDDADDSTAASTDLPSSGVDALPGIGGGAAPGPSTKMYDLVLDAYAIAAARSDIPPVEAIERSRRLLNTVLARHEADGGPSNVNPHTMPTPMSFNAPLRTAAAVVPSSDGAAEGLVIRDEALDLAFVTYDKMFRCDCVLRNAATYKYMLDVVVKFLPPSRSKGNIAYGIFTKAKEEGVVDGGVLDAAVAVGMGNGGVDYDTFLAHLEKEGVESWRDLPHKWRMNNLRRRQPNCRGVY